MNKESLFKRSEQTSLFPEEDIHKNDQHNPSINININNNKIDPKLNKQYNKENNSFISRKRIENLDENNSKQDKTEINIYESQEKSFHNSPQSSKKIKLPISQVPVSILEDRREENWGESGRGINTRTMNSEINKQDIENFLLDTPSEVTLTLNLQKNSYK